MGQERQASSLIFVGGRDFFGGGGGAGSIIGLCKLIQKFDAKFLSRRFIISTNVRMFFI